MLPLFIEVLMTS